jgi:multidrug efflux pump subunit AcrA (membrane-fusion protein)
MAENTVPQDSIGVSNDAPSATAPKRGFWHNVWQILRVIQARLRFIAILAVIGGVIMYWDRLKAHYDKWMRVVSGETTVASTDNEYWCPMHPTIVRDHPDKCPICGMPLSKRKKSEGADTDEALPPGIVSRVQLTPWRVAQAGIQTVAIEYQPLTKDITTVGFVEFDERTLARITVRPTGKSRIEKLQVNFTGQIVQKGEPLALLYSPDLTSTVDNMLNAQRSKNAELLQITRERLLLWGIEKDQIEKILQTGKPTTYLTVPAPIGGHVIRKYVVEGDSVEEGAKLYDIADLSTVWIEAQVYEDDLAFLGHGIANKLPVVATTKAFPNREFKGRLSFVHPHLDATTRTLKVRFDMDNPNHDLRPGMYATVTLQVPATRLIVLPAEAGDEQKRAYQRGLVLAVPERAVIDTGSRKIIYREAEPDQFEGVEVHLGPRTGAFYPVIRGLQAGDRVATAGSFLIDAETRLTAGAGSTYFGASGAPQTDDRRSGATSVRPSTTRDDEDKVKTNLSKLSLEDRQLAEAQIYCPVLSDNRLGSMGVPVKVMVKSQPVFLCCKGCVDNALAEPQKTLDKVAELKAKAGTPKSDSTPGAKPMAGSAKVQAALAKLSPEDRRLAETQGKCPIIEDNQLGAMGTPVKVILKGQSVFLCCKGCEDEARNNPNRTLDKVVKLKAEAKVATPPK